MSVRLNLGCGIILYPNFINVDKYVTMEMIQDLILHNHPQVKIYPGAEYLNADMMDLPFEDNSVDYIESADTLEHFGFREVGKVLSEMKRVLKPGCTARIQTINFDGIAREWMKRVATDYETIIVNDNWMDAYFEVMQTVYGNQHNEGQFHKCAWTPRYAYQMFIIETGFTYINITIIPRGSNAPSGLEVAPTVEGHAYISEALIIEAVK